MAEPGVGTTLGERVMRPDFGCNLEDHVFEAMNASNPPVLEADSSNDGNNDDGGVIHEATIVSATDSSDEDNNNNNNNNNNGNKTLPKRFSEKFDLKGRSAAASTTTSQLRSPKPTTKCFKALEPFK